MPIFILLLKLDTLNLGSICGSLSAVRALYFLQASFNEKHGIKINFYNTKTKVDFLSFIGIKKQHIIKTND